MCVCFIQVIDLRSEVQGKLDCVLLPALLSCTFVTVLLSPGTGDSPQMSAAVREQVARRGHWMGQQPGLAEHRSPSSAPQAGHPLHLSPGLRGHHVCDVRC